MNFVPKRPDGRSLRAIAVELIGPKTPDTIVTYQEIGAALGVSPRNHRNLIQGAINQAQSGLLKLYQRSVVAIPNVGYRVIRADEHRGVAVAKQSAAERQMKKGLRLLTHARLDEMSAEGRQLHQQQAMIMSATLAGFKYHENRLNKIEELLRGTPPTINQS